VSWSTWLAQRGPRLENWNRPQWVAAVLVLSLLPLLFVGAAGFQANVLVALAWRPVFLSTYLLGAGLLLGYYATSSRYRQAWRFAGQLHWAVALLVSILFPAILCFSLLGLLTSLAQFFNQTPVQITARITRLESLSSNLQGCRQKVYLQLQANEPLQLLCPDWALPAGLSEGQSVILLGRSGWTAVAVDQIRQP
jgi:hypothetical protein